MLVRYFLRLILALAPAHAWATNDTCEELKLELQPIYDALQSRLRQHMFTRDNNLKITVEQDTEAYIRLSQIADRYDKRMVNVIRDFNDGDPEAERLCRALVISANCEAYQIYLRTVINLPAINRPAVEAESVRRCQSARQSEGASYEPADGAR